MKQNMFGKDVVDNAIDATIGADITMEIDVTSIADVTMIVAMMVVIANIYEQSAK